MTDTEFNQKQEELDRLLNDPETALRPDRVWSLLEDLARASPDAERAAA
ncbi:MAG: peptide chain release factor 1 [Acetobacteraceae bacterium]|nr:peptide chain release factor 1 [Acetobacteraceae bacterium]